MTAGNDKAGHAGRTAWSLRRRLVLSLVLCIGGSFAVLFVALDHWIDHDIYQRMDTTLMQRTTAVGRVLQEMDMRGLQRLMPEYEPGGHTEFFTVFDPRTGQAVLRSPSSAGAVLSRGDEKEGVPRYYNLTLPDGHAGRALAMHVPVAGGGMRLLVVATEREGWDHTERHIHFTLMGGITLATLLATGLALFLVQRLLVMLQRASAPLAGLRVDQPMQPIGSGFPRELRPFADAFNLGLHHLYSAVARERRFSSDVAHELRTPLAEIRASAESALGDADPLHAQRSLRAVVQVCSRMQRSVDTLLLLARLESGQHPLAADPLDLAALVRELAAALQGQNARSQPVDMVLPASAWVRSDLGVTERIVSNLLRNAMDYAPADDRIQCCLERGQAGWVLTISNAAPELLDSDLEQFGVRFWRKRSEGGTVHHAGLGLALAFALAQTIALPLRFSLEEGRLVARLGPWQPLL